ncbi:unnamed protein product [Schistosoma intercalatum]|nr:unnamed protein product [Schistosoma intercalatum]CAH8623239.1 unnamed protein product [Schistosoma intercalatum]
MYPPYMKRKIYGRNQSRLCTFFTLTYEHRDKFIRHEFETKMDYDVTEVITCCVASNPFQSVRKCRRWHSNDVTFH